MESVVRDAVLLTLTDSLRSHGSWCGETHLQKATYFLQEVTRVPLRFEYVLYRHGPFSFDLRKELTAMRANNLLALEPAFEYGPRFKATDVGAALLSFCTDEVKPYERSVEFVSSWLGPMGVVELERAATALFVIRTDENESDAQQVELITTYKPHISRELAQSAIQDVKSKLKQYAA